MNHYFVWVVATKMGGYRVFKQKPNRDTVRDVWIGDYDAKGQVALAHLEALGMTLPSLTWEDDPVKIKIGVEIWDDQEK